MDLTCKFCGKSILNLDNKKFKSNKESQEYATLHCCCSESVEYRKFSQSKERLSYFINTCPYSDDVKNFLELCGQHIMKFKNDVLVYQIDNLRIKFSIKKGNLLIQIITTDKLEKII